MLFQKQMVNPWQVCKGFKVAWFEDEREPELGIPGMPKMHGVIKVVLG